MHAPFFYPKIIAGPDSFCPAGEPAIICFDQEGHETHDGIELNAEGKAANWLRLNGFGRGDERSLNRHRHTRVR